MPCSPAVAGGPEWVKITSQNFEVLTTAGERAGRGVILRFEQVRSFFAQAAGLDTANGQPVRIVLFRSDKEFRPYQPNEVAEAYYMPGSACDYIIMRNSGEQASPVAVHEYTHLLARHFGGPKAVWFNEGLAELYSNMRPIGSQIAVGSPIESHRFVLVREKWIPLEQVVSAGHDSPLYNEKARAGVFYAESWALVHMLALDAQYRPGYNACVGELDRGSGAGDAFRKVYNKSLREVQKDLEAYVRGTQFRAALFNVKLPKNTDQPEVRPATALESGLVLADVLANQKSKFPQAQEALEGLASQYPQSWEAQQGLAYLNWHGGKIEPSIGHFRRASELGCTNPKMYYDYGLLLASRGTRDDAITALKRATALDPADRETHLNLGRLLVEDGKYGEALGEFQSVKTVKPDEAFRFFYAAAYAHFKLGQKAQARKTAEIGLKHAKNAEETAPLQRLLAALEERPPSVPEQSASEAGSAPARKELKRRPLEERVVAGRSAPKQAKSGPGVPERAAGGEDRPRLGRAAAEPDPESQKTEATAAAKTWPAIEGTLDAVDCMGKTARLQVFSGGRRLAFDITDAENVQLRNGTGAAIEFTCGRQNGKPIRIEYEPKPGGRIEGVVRAITLR